MTNEELDCLDAAIKDGTQVMVDTMNEIIKEMDRIIRYGKSFEKRAEGVR